MPQIVELPDKTEIEFPDGMSADDINREISKAFPGIDQPEPSRLEKVLSAIQPGAAAVGEAMKKNALPPPDEPIAKVPTFGEPGTFTHGVSKGVAGLAESMLTPEGAVIAGALTVPGVNVVLGTALSAAAVKQAAQQAGEFSVTKNPETLGEAAVTGAAGVVGLAGVAAGRIAEMRKAVAPQTVKALEETGVVKPEPPKVEPVAEPPKAEPVKTEPTLETQAELRAQLDEALGQEPSVDVFRPEALQTEAVNTVGLKPSASNPLAFVENLKGIYQKWFTAKGNLPEEVYALKQELEASKNVSDFEIRMRERDLMAALGETYGLSKLEMAGGGSRRIPAKAVQLMDDYLKGGVANAAAIPPKVRSILDTMRAEIDAKSVEVMDTLNDQLAQVPPNSAKAKSLTDLIDKIRSNIDIYVHRSYKFFDSEKPAPDWYADLNAGVRAKAEDFLVQNATAPLTRAEAQSRLLDWLSDLRDGEANGSGKLGSKDLSIFMKRKVIAPEIRAVLGEYHNPLVNYAKSVSKMADWVAKQKFLDEVKRKGMGSFLFEEGSNPPGFNTQIAADSSSTMSPLNGLRTTQEIADAFRDVDRVTDHGLIAQTYLTLNAWTKFAATALSWKTQARNIAGRPFMSGMAGHWQVEKLGPSVRAIFEDFAGKDPAWRAYLKNAYRHGVIGDTARSGELQAVIKDAALRDVAPAQLYSWSLAQAVKKYGYKIPAEVYRLSDELGNLFGWENEKAIQAKINPTWSKDMIEAKAAKIIRSIYPTYSETPRAIKSFRVLPVGPFVTFPYQIFRTTWNALGQSFHEIRSANPVERAVGYKRLTSQIATLTASHALQGVGKATIGVSTQQEDDFRRFQPSWSRNSQFLFIGKEKGELSAINLSYLDPYSYMTDPIVAVARSVREDKDLFEIFAETAGELFEPWISEQMLAKAIIEARNGKTDSGREIVNPTDDPQEAFQKRIGHVFDSLKPGTMQRIEKRIIPAIKNEQPIYGRKLEVGPEIAAELTGMAVEQFNFKDGLAFRSREFVDKDRSAESVFHQTISRTQTTTPEDLLNAYKESDERRFKVWQELRKDFLAAVRQGVTVPEARKTMEARGMTKHDINRIANGHYEALNISDQAKKRARERGRELPLAEIRAYRVEAAKRSLD